MRRLLAWGLMLALCLGMIQAKDKDSRPPKGKDASRESRAGEGIEHKATMTIDTGSHIGVIASMAFTPDGKRLVTVGFDRSIQEYDPVTGERLRVIRLPAPRAEGGQIQAAVLLRGFARDSGGRILAVSANGVDPTGKGLHLRNKLLLFHRELEKIISLELPHFPVTAIPEALAARPNLGRLAAARGETIFVYNKLGTLWGSGASQERRTPAWTLKAAEGKRVRSLGLSPDGTRLAAGTMTTGAGRLFVWGLPTKGEPKLLNNSSLETPTLGLAWSPSGKLIATGHRVAAKQAPVRLWTGVGKLEKSIPRDQLTSRIKGGVIAVDQVVFRSEDELLLTMSWFTKGKLLGNQLVLSYDLKSGKSRELLFIPDITTPHPGADQALVPLVVSPDGKLAAVGVEPHGGRIAWLDLTGKDKPRFSGGTYGLRGPVGWSKDGSSIAWRTKQSRVLNRKLNLEKLTFRISRVNADEFTKEVRERDGWKVEVAGTPGKRYVQIFKDGKPIARTRAEVQAINHLTLSGKGDKPWVAWTDLENLFISDPVTGKVRHHLHPSPTRFLGLAPSPDGRYLLAATSRELLYVYHVTGLQTILRPLLTIYTHGRNWIVWTRRGYYAATPPGERMMGWSINNGVEKPSTFHPASWFRKQLHRPELIPLVLEKGEASAALKAFAKTEAGARTRSVENVDDLLPPTIEIDNVDTTELPRVKVTAKAKASAAGQPITSLRLLLNGRPLPAEEYLVDLGKGKKEYTKTWTVEVPEGKNELAVLARSEDSMAVSPEKVVTYKQPPAARLLALCIGVNKYAQKKIELKAAVNDANAVAQALEKRCGKPLFATAKARVLADKQATKKKVLDALAELKTKGNGLGAVKPTDLVVMFFAGHGVKVKGEYYLLPQDAKVDNAEDVARSCISGTELRKALTAFPCQVLLLLDACHSGAVGRAFSPANDDVSREMADEEVGVVVMAAAMGREYAMEKADPKGKPRGFFARAVEEGINRQPGVPFNFRDKYVYVHHLFGYVFDRVKDLSEDAQHPSLNLPSTVESFPLVPSPN